MCRLLEDRKHPGDAWLAFRNATGFELIRSYFHLNNANCLHSDNLACTKWISPKTTHLSANWKTAYHLKIVVWMRVWLLLKGSTNLSLYKLGLAD